MTDEINDLKVKLSEKSRAVDSFKLRNKELVAMNTSANEKVADFKLRCSEHQQHILA